MDGENARRSSDSVGTLPADSGPSGIYIAEKIGLNLQQTLWRERGGLVKKRNQIGMEENKFKVQELGHSFHKRNTALDQELQMAPE